MKQLEGDTLAKPEGEGFLSIAEAVDAAATELGEGNPDDSNTDDPLVEETLFEEDDQAASEVEEQPETEGDTEAPSADVEEAEVEDDEDSDEEDDSLFGDLDIDDEDSEESVDLESETFELPNGEVVEGLQQLKDGYLRNADYTQKTQKLADERKAMQQQYAEAERIHGALKNDPMGFFQSLAKQLGVEGVEVTGAKNPDFKLNDTENFEAEVEKRVQERIDGDPDIQQARQQAAVAKVEGEFDRIEGERDLTIQSEDRKKVLRFAADNDITNLDVAFDALMARVNAKKQKASERQDRVKKTATKRPGTRVPEDDVTTPPKSVREAAQRAAAEMAAS